MPDASVSQSNESAPSIIAKVASLVEARHSVCALALCCDAELWPRMLTLLLTPGIEIRVYPGDAACGRTSFSVVAPLDGDNVPMFKDVFHDLLATFVPYAVEPLILGCTTIEEGPDTHLCGNGPYEKEVTLRVRPKTHIGGNGVRDGLFPRSATMRGSIMLRYDSTRFGTLDLHCAWRNHKREFTQSQIDIVTGRLLEAGPFCARLFDAGARSKTGRVGYGR